MLDIDDDEHMLLCKTNSTNTGTKTEIKPGAKAFVKEAFEGPKVREAGPKAEEGISNAIWR